MKRLIGLAVAVAVTGCAQGRVTECGIFVQTSDPGVFAEVQALEREFVALADRVVSPNDPRFADTCKALDGWSVEFVAQLEVTRDNGEVEDLKGQTWINARAMVIETKATVRASGLVHEFGHAVQRGEPKCSAGYDSMHGCWDQNGLTYVIDTVRGGQ